MSMLPKIRKELRRLANPRRVALAQRFFKTGTGEYGEGDIFLGLTVPQSRVLARRYRTLRRGDVQRLLASRIHEERLIALLILVDQMELADTRRQKRIYDFYLRHARRVNNWDLVDTSAHKIVGLYLYNARTSRSVLRQLARSSNLWERRIAMISCAYFIGKNEFGDALAIAEILRDDSHDLIHKAVGWMLREIGKRDRKAEERFLKKYYRSMPRTMLRYAIERFPERVRQAYLSGTI